MSTFRRVAGLSGTAAVVLVAAATSGAAAPSHPGLPTWHVSVTATGQQVSGTTYLESGTVSRDGSQIGLDLLTCPGAAQEGVAIAHCTVTFGLEGGTLLATLSLDNASGAVTGRLAGGTGSYAHAEGSVTGQGTDAGADLTLTFARHD